MRVSKSTVQIHVNQQSDLKGLLWGSAGTFLFALSTVLTARVAVRCIAGLAMKWGTRPVSGRVIEAMKVRPVENLWKLARYVATTIIANYLATKASARCMHNAIYHLGPSHQLVPRSPTPSRASKAP